MQVTDIFVQPGYHYILDVLEVIVNIKVIIISSHDRYETEYAECYEQEVRVPRCVFLGILQILDDFSDQIN